MEPIIAAIIAALATTLAAGGGFWGYISKKDHLKENNAKILMGLAHDKITTLGLSYLDRGWVSKDEYEDLRRFLYDPYVALGGNGTAERIMHAVERLPFRQTHFLDVPIRKTDRTAADEAVVDALEKYQGEERRRAEEHGKNYRISEESPYE